MKKIELSEGTVIVMGDFNFVIDKNMDKSGKTTSHAEMPQGWKKCLTNQRLVDIWREHNKLIRDYTFFQVAKFPVKDRLCI